MKIRALTSGFVVSRGVLGDVIVKTPNVAFCVRGIDDFGLLLLVYSNFKLVRPFFLPIS